MSGSVNREQIARSPPEGRARSREAQESELANYREFIAEMAGFIRVNAGLAGTYCEIADDAGLEYSIRRLVGCVRAAVETMNDLKRAKQRAREEQA